MSNPKKEYGTTRHLGIPNYNATKGIKAYEAEISKNSVIKELSYLNTQNGGHVIWEKGHQHEDEGQGNNEFLFAKGLADLGYWVHLLPERDADGAITLRLSLKGNKTFVDGKVKSLTGVALYEQWTPVKANDKYGILKGLQHASDKGCGILAIYDPTNILNREHVRTGMKLYDEGLKSQNKNYIKLKGVVTYNARGEFHSWYWE